MRQVFADTAYWIALLNPRDPSHTRATDAERAHTAYQIITSDMILVELLNAFSKPQYMRHAVLRVLFAIKQDARVLVEPQSRELFNAAVRLYQDRPDKEWGLTDCASMVIMKNMDIEDVLTTDHHFQQAGFRIVM